MKKKVISMMLAATLVVSMLAGCVSGTEEEGDAGTEAEGDYQFVSPEDAVSAAADGETHVLDIREWADYAEGRVANSEWCPIFPLEDESLVDAMAEYAEKNLKDGEEIYLICNSGQKGAQKATTVLADAGIDEALIYTVEGGAKALAEVRGALTTNRADESIEWQYVSGADALAAYENGEAQIVDVRDDDTYAEGYIADSLQVDLEEIEDAEAQTAAYELADGMDKDEPVYFLCYSGNKCAKTAISVFRDAGFDLSGLYIIEEGAKDEDIAAAFVTE